MTRFKDKFKVKNGLKHYERCLESTNHHHAQAATTTDGSMFTQPPSREFLVMLVLLIFSSLLWFGFSINIDIVQGKMKISSGKNSRIRII